MSTSGTEDPPADYHPELSEAYRTFRATTFRHLSSLQGPLPQRLFHYTTLGAMKSIVESGCLWASHAAFLNDSSELKYSHAIFESIVGELAGVEQTEVGREFLQRAPRAIDPFMRQLFLLCLCEDGDLLSQWRSYAHGAGGYSLGLEGRELDRVTRFSVEEGGREHELRCAFVKVNYDRNEHVTVIRGIVQSVLDILRTLTSSMTVLEANTLIAEALGVTRAHLFEVYPRFKDPAFHEENEWRLVFSLETARPPAFLKFRASGPHLVPYLDVRCSARVGKRTGRLPLECVTVGPVALPEITEAGVRMFLGRHGYTFTTVERSKIPLR